MTKFNYQIFNLAFGIFQEFGPNRRVPADKRIQTRFSSLSTEEVFDLIKRFNGIESFAFDIAEQIHNKNINNLEGRNLIASEFPELNAERLAQALNQAMYFSCK